MTTKVVPSAGALVSALTAMPPFAPERFSTTMVWLSRSCMRVPTMRATVSGSPPAGCVMMNLMVGAVAGWRLRCRRSERADDKRGKRSERGARLGHHGLLRR